MTEAEVLAGVPKDLLIGGEWRPAEGGARLAVEDPATGEVLCEVADGSVADAKAALDAACAAQAQWAAASAARAWRDLAPCVRADCCADRRAGDLDDDRDGQVAGGVARGDHLRERVHALVQRGGGADRRPLCGQPERAEPTDHDAPARRAVSLDHAVELSARDGDAQGRARRSLRAARWSSSRPSRRLCRCSRSPRSWRRRGCRPGC